MAHNINFVGNLGSDPEMRYTADGTAVCNVSIADNRSWTDKDGKKQKETTWFRCSFWGAQAETVNQYFKKGDGIYIRQARLKVDKETGGPVIWDGDDGPRATFELQVQNWEFVGKSSGSGKSNNQQANDVVEDEIPF